MQIRPLLIPLFLLLITASPAQAQEERLALDWIFSDEGKTATTVPRFAWLDNNRVVLYDTQRPESERTLRVLDASGGRIRDLVDADDVIEAMTEILEPDDPIEELGWPARFGPAGRYAVYEKSGHLLLVNLRNDDVTLAAADGASTPRFSPDGEWLAFVRNNDLYAWHIEDEEETRLTTDGSDTLLNGTVSWVYWEELLGRSDRGFEWSPDSTSIVYLQTDESGVGEMHYVDFEPNLPRVIHQRHPKPGEANPRVRAGIVTVEDPATTWIDLGAYPYEYLVRMQWLPDSSRVAVQTLNRPQTVLDIFVADAGTGSATHLMHSLMRLPTARAV